MSSSLTDLQAKQATLKERKAADKRVAMEVDQIAKKYAVDDDIPSPRGCFPSLLSCGGAFFHRRHVVATSDRQASEAATSTHSVTKGGAVMARFVGKSKKQASESETARIDSAMEAVQSRLEGLSDRLVMARKKAMAAQKAGKREEALREMKKVKAAEKQHATAQAALEALERQADALAQTSLQKELASALASTNKQMKQKSKGLLSFAEKTIDDAIEVADDAEDVAQVFEGLVPGGGAAYDEEELREELEAMVGEEDGIASAVDSDLQSTAPMASVAATEVSAPSGDALWDRFPVAPSSRVANRAVKEDRQALLSSD